AGRPDARIETDGACHPLCHSWRSTSIAMPPNPAAPKQTARIAHATHLRGRSCARQALITHYSSFRAGHSLARRALKPGHSLALRALMLGTCLRLVLGWTEPR